MAHIMQAWKQDQSSFRCLHLPAQHRIFIADTFSLLTVRSSMGNLPDRVSTSYLYTGLPFLSFEALMSRMDAAETLFFLKPPSDIVSPAPHSTVKQEAMTGDQRHARALLLTLL